MKKLLNWLWPQYCLLCKEITTGFSMCSTCINALPWNLHGCTQCGLPIALTSPIQRCGVCLSKPPSFAQTRALFIYKAPITHFITQLKFNRQLLYANLVGNLFADKFIKNSSDTILPECIIPVPLHRRRLRQRGFNQALEIAKPLAKKLQLPIDFKTCIRAKHTHPQSELPAKKRRQNMKNAFALKKPINAKHVAILDDVVTTGNTVTELSKLLRKNGVEKIEVWCCARVIYPCALK